MRPLRICGGQALVEGEVRPCDLLIAALRRRDMPRAGLAALVLAALLANAFAAGALSKPHDRYQARIAWLLLVPPAFQIGARASTSAGERRTSCS